MKSHLNDLRLVKKTKMVLKKSLFQLLSTIDPVIPTNFLYKRVYKESLNLESPKGFNEKIQWLKFNKFDNLVIKCADKYEMRDYVKEVGLSEILPKLYAVFNNVNEINFSHLPNRFVLKCTHGCGYNIICSDKTKLDEKSTKKILKNWMKEEYGYHFCEYHYNEIQSRIICEEFLEDCTHDSLVDYKFFCFNGKPRYILVCLDRGDDIKKVFYDLNWNKVNFRKDNADLNIECPSSYKQMLEYAACLATPFPFVRVDFYHVNDKPILGELTFTPAAGLSTEYTKEADLFLGDLIKLPN